MIRRTASALVLSATVLGAQSRFEGSIAMNMAGDGGKPREVSYFVKGGKIRMEMAGARGEQMTMIMNPAAKEMLILMPAQKMYMVQAMGAAADAAEKSKPPTIARTGKTETIAGYKCEYVTVTAEDGISSDVCVAKGIGAFRMPSSGGRGGPPKAEPWQGALGDGGFPLKVVKGGKVMLEVTNLEKKTLDAAQFEPPEGYRKMDMGGMMRRRP